MSEETHDHTHETQPDPSAPAVPNFKFGFVVLVSEGGDIFVEKDAAAFSIPVEREASLLEIRRYTSELLMDLQAQSAAEYTTLRLQADKEANKA